MRDLGELRDPPVTQSGLGELSDPSGPLVQEELESSLGLSDLGSESSETVDLDLQVLSCFCWHVEDNFHLFEPFGL